MTTKSKVYQIRYNTVSKDDENIRWRLIENGNETLVSNIYIDGHTYTTKDWIEEINDYKWHISCVGHCEIKNNCAYITTIKEDRVLLRHILKTISYRIFATLITILTALYLGASFEISTLLGVGELLIKPVFYFLHERFWYKFVKIKN
jgi:uncharacterized membrane protein